MPLVVASISPSNRSSPEFPDGKSLGGLEGEEKTSFTHTKRKQKTTPGHGRRISGSLLVQMVQKEVKAHHCGSSTGHLRVICGSSLVHSRIMNRSERRTLQPFAQGGDDVFNSHASGACAEIQGHAVFENGRGQGRHIVD